MRARCSVSPTQTLWTPPGSSANSTLSTWSVSQLGAEALGLLAQLAHQIGALDPLGEAGIVLDVGRLLQQAAPGEALDDKRGKVGARGVKRCGVARGSAADDDRVLDIRHLAGSVL